MTPTTRIWRLMIDGAGAPAWNMAVDEALLESGIAGSGVPTLRLYWWRPHALSLGAHQEAAGAVDWEALGRDGYGVVRRPTGGRAILHAQELTYSVTAPAPPGGTLAAYRWLAEGLAAGLQGTGIPVRLERNARVRADGIDTRHPCFLTSGRYELMAAGRKLVGSAQERRRGWLMQHGSILLGPEHLRLPRYLHATDLEAEEARLRQVTVDCSSIVGRQISAATLAPQFARGFSEGLGISLEAGELTPPERRTADLLVADRFATEAWTRSGTHSAVRQTAGG